MTDTIETLGQRLDAFIAKVEGLPDRLKALEEREAEAARKAIHDAIDGIHARVDDLAKEVKAHVSVEVGATIDHVAAFEDRIHRALGGPRAVVVALLLGLVLGAVGAYAGLHGLAL